MIKITKEMVIEYASKYDKNEKAFDKREEKGLKEWLAGHKYLDKEKFVRLGRWKSKRPTKLYKSNDDSLIKDITKFSFSTKNEEARIKSLLVLSGVSWPVASVILHFTFPSSYPILDFRALESLGIEKPKSYNFNFWQRYCERVREIAKNVQEDIRTVDKALWAYSQEYSKIINK